MAMLGMQTDTQNSFFSPYYPSRDVNSNAGTRGIWPSNDVDKLVKSGACYGSSPMPLYSEKHLPSKELFRRTMIQHDAIFRQQINDLHRLYKRQKELMDEMKRSTLNRHHLQLETLWSHPFFSQNSEKTYQASPMAWLNHAHSQLCITGAGTKSSPLILDEDKAIQASRPHAQAEGRMKEHDESKSKKNGKRLLDLELPGVEYIDIEEEDSFTGNGILQVSQMESNAPNGDLEYLKKNANMDCSISGAVQILVDLNEIPKLDDETDPSSDNLFDSVTCNAEIIDQHIPDKTFSECQSHLGGVTRNISVKKDSQAGVNGPLHENENVLVGLLNKDENGQSSCDLNSCPEDLSVETLPTSSEGNKIEEGREILLTKETDPSSGKSDNEAKNPLAKSIEGGGFSNIENPVEAASSEHSSSQLLNVAVATNGEKSSGQSSSLKHLSDTVSSLTVVQALPCFKSGVEANKRPRFASRDFTGSKLGKGQSTKDGGGAMSGLIPGIKRLHLTCDKPIISTDNSNNNSNRDGVADIVSDCNSVPSSGKYVIASNLITKNRRQKISPSFGILIDLNACVSEDDSSPSLSPEINLDVTGGTEDKPCPPSGGDSNKTQVDESSESVQEIGNQLEELVRYMAEALISISSSQVQSNAVIDTLSFSEDVQDDSLHWFAGIASSVVDNPGSMFDKFASIKDVDGADLCCSDGIDYFEAMTLSLKEMKMDGPNATTSIQLVEAANSIELPSQPTRGRTRRGRMPRKDFQSEILPSIATLSRHEVTEDLLSFGGLMDTSRTRKNSITRKTVKNRRTSARRSKPPASPSNDSTIAAAEKHKKPKQIELNVPSCWGKIATRPRGPRTAATNPWLVFNEA